MAQEDLTQAGLAEPAWEVLLIPARVAEPAQALLLAGVADLLRALLIPAWVADLMRARLTLAWVAEPA